MYNLKTSGDIALTEKALFFLILLFSFILKGILVFSTQVPNPDGVNYINAARAFAQGNFQQGVRIHAMPFYPLLITAFHYLIPDWIRAAQTISWLSMVLAAVPLYKITKILFNQKAAMWSILAYSLAPHFNTYASKIIRDPLGLFMLSLAILFVLKSLEGKKIKDFFLASVFSILAFLCRVEYFLFPLFLIFFYLGSMIVDRQQAIPLGKGIGLFILIPLCAGIILWLLCGKNLNHILRLATLKHYFINNAIHMDFLRGYRNIYQQLKILGQSLPNPSFTGNFAETARHYIWLIYIVALLETAVILIFPTNFIPLFYKLRAYKHNRNHYFIFGVILLFTGSTFFFLVFRNFIQKRYLIIPAFLLFPGIGNGLYFLSTKACSYKKRGKVVAISLFFFLFLILPTGKTLSYVGEHNPSLKEAGLWLANHIETKKDVKLLSNDRRIPFFAGLDKNTIVISQRTFKRINLKKYAHRRKVQIIALAISPKKKAGIPDLKAYKILKEFHDRKNIVIIAASNQ